MLKKEDTRSRTLNDSSNSSDTDPYSGVTLNKKNRFIVPIFVQLGNGRQSAVEITVHL